VGPAGRGPSHHAGRSLVPCTGGTGTAVLWFPARAVRARPFSGSQYGRSVVWRRNAALPAGERGGGQRREEKRREERS